MAKILSQYYVIEVKFKGNTWEQLGDRHPSLKRALDRQEEIDLSFENRIVKVTRTIAIAEIKEKNSANTTSRRSKKIHT